jgi:hypothetical protein
MNLNTKNVFYLILFVFFVRVVTILFIGKIPCMDSIYLQLGTEIFSDTVGTVKLSPFYSVVIFLLTNILGGLFNASAAVYIFGGMIISVYIYLSAKLIYDETTARIALLISAIFPSITIAVAGYSHSVVLAAAFEIMAVYYFLWFLKSKNFLYVLFVVPLIILSIMTRPEALIVVVPFILIVCLLKLYEENTGFYNEDSLQETSIATQESSAASAPIGVMLGMVFREKNKSILIFLLIIVSSVVCFTLAHKSFVYQFSHDKTYAGVFTDKVYSYMTFVTTFSMREYGQYGTPQEIMDTSVPFIGTPESNNYSVLTAILRYPARIISNIFFNAKELLDNLAHPLFTPFYFYIFIGLIFSRSNPRSEIRTTSLLALLAFFHIVPLVLFHVEIRYMTAIGIILIFLISRGVFYMENKKLASVIILPPSLAIYMVYVYKFSGPAFSMCGF